MSTLTIGELSERSGVPASALRFYESKGLLSSTRNRREPASVPARRASPSLVHPRCTTGRARAQRDQRRPRQPPRRPNPHPEGLGAPRPGMAPDARSPHPLTRGSPRPARLVHRLRVPPPHHLRPAEPRRRGTRPRERTALPARRPSLGRAEVEKWPDDTRTPEPTASRQGVRQPPRPAGQ